MIAAQLRGSNEAAEMFKKLGIAMETKILRGAVSRGVNIIRDEARLRVSVDSGLTLKAIKSSRKTVAGMVIGKVRLRGEHSFLGWFLEYGVRPRGMLHTATAGLRIAPFLRPAFDAKRAEVIAAIGAHIREQLIKFKAGTLSGPAVAVDEDDE